MDNIKLPEKHIGKAQNQGTTATFGTVHIQSVPGGMCQTSGECSLC